MWRGCRRYRYSQRAPVNNCPHDRACHATADGCPDDHCTHACTYCCRHPSPVDADGCPDNRSSDACAIHPHASRSDKGCAHCSANSDGGSDAGPIYTCGDGCGYSCTCDVNSCSARRRNAATRAAAHPYGSATSDG